MTINTLQKRSFTPPCVPAGYADFSEESEEPEGYFALYNKQKSLRCGTGLAQSHPGQALSGTPGSCKSIECVL